MTDNIPQREYEFAETAIENILRKSVENIELTDKVPPLSEITDSNKVFNGKLSILFVDMRDSSELTEKLDKKKMVKIYRSFTRIIIQAIRYSGGHSRQFAGDGIMGVFQDSYKDGVMIASSSEQAIKSARYIITMIDYCLNPGLKKYMDNVSISCGVGIATGDIMITKVGMRGKEADESFEDELGIVWVGSTTNNANRYCSLAGGGEIFIDSSTYKESNENIENWEVVSKMKGIKYYKGYLSTEYYLDIDVDTTPIKASKKETKRSTITHDIFEETRKEAQLFIKELINNTEKSSIKLIEVEKKEKELKLQEISNNQKELDLIELEKKLTNKNKQLESKSLRLKQDEYDLNRNFFSNTFIKDDLIIQLGKEFWLNRISDMFDLGAKINKNKLEVKKDLSHYLIHIYKNIEMYEESYDALCIQAEYGSWLSTLSLEEIVKKSGHWIRLERILNERLNEIENKTLIESINKSLEKLKEMGY